MKILELKKESKNRDWCTYSSEPWGAFTDVFNDTDCGDRSIVREQGFEHLLHHICDGWYQQLSRIKEW